MPRAVARHQPHTRMICTRIENATRASSAGAAMAHRVGQRVGHPVGRTAAGRQAADRGRRSRQSRRPPRSRTTPREGRPPRRAAGAAQIVREQSAARGPARPYSTQRAIQQDRRRRLAGARRNATARRRDRIGATLGTKLLTNELTKKTRSTTASRGRDPGARAARRSIQRSAISVRSTNTSATAAAIQRRSAPRAAVSTDAGSDAQRT